MILLPREVDDLDSFSRILSAGRVGLFSDFDGTLTPLFDDPRNTVLSPAIRDTLSELSKKVELVAVVSGREVRFLREMIGLKSVTYVGNHGLEEWKTGGEQQEYVVQVSDGLLEEVEKGVAGIGVSGFSVENKVLSVAVHYRNAPDPTATRSAVSQMLKSLAATRDLQIKEGKMVLEIVPGAGVNKGTVDGGSCLLKVVRRDRDSGGHGPRAVRGQLDSGGDSSAPRRGSTSESRAPPVRWKWYPAQTARRAS